MSHDKKKPNTHTDPKKDAAKVTEPAKDGVKADPKKDETIKH